MTQHRNHHKQEPNMLADWLNAKLEALEPHRTTLAVVAGGVLLVAVLGMFVFTGQSASARDWSAYLSAFSVDDPKHSLESLATGPKAPNTPPIWYAKLALADRLAAEGARETFLNRVDAKKLLEDAVTYYKEVETSATSQPQLRNRARLGLAGAYESLVLPDDAKQVLEIVKKDSEADSVLHQTADESLRRLDNARTLETLTWFAAQEPAPKTNPHGLNFGEGVTDRPNFPGVKPLGPAPELPGDLPLDAPATDKPVEKPEGDAPKTEDKKPEEKPAATPPATTPPATTPPATTPPATTPPATTPPATTPPATTPPATTPPATTPPATTPPAKPAPPAAATPPAAPATTPPAATPAKPAAPAATPPAKPAAPPATTPAAPKPAGTK